MLELGVLDRERLSQIRLLNGYLKRADLPAAFAVRVKTDFMSQQKIAINNRNSEVVLGFLPKQIMMDLLYEIRAPVLDVHMLFSDFHQEFPRMLRRVCAEATKLVPVQADELVFARGDACARVFFVESGELTYEWAPASRSSQRSRRLSAPVSGGSSPKQIVFHHTESSERDNEDDDVVNLSAGHWLSEAALWIEWEHCGQLKAVSQSSFLTLEVPDFISVVTLFKEARVRCVLYARSFLSSLMDLPRQSDVLAPLDEYMQLPSSRTTSKESKSSNALERSLAPLEDGLVTTGAP